MNYPLHWLYDFKNRQRNTGWMVVREFQPSTSWKDVETVNHTLVEGLYEPSSILYLDGCENRQPSASVDGCGDRQPLTGLMTVGTGTHPLASLL